MLIVWPLFAWAAALALVVQPEANNADALAVLAGSATYQERTRYAAELFRAGRAPRVVLTNDNLQGGWSVAAQRNPFFVERAALELQQQGVPAERIDVIPQAVTSTYDEAVRLREYAGARGLQSLLVVTSAYQSRRARWVLRRVFHDSQVTVTLDPVAPGMQTPTPATWWWHRRGWQMVAGEYVKLVYYFIRYR